MRKKLLLTFSGFIFLFLSVSCKHEIPTNNMVEDPTGDTSDPCDPNKIYFEQQVLPILLSNCAKSGCHDNITREEGVVLTSYSSVMNTGEVRPGNPTGSKLYKMIITTNLDDRMPPPPAEPLSTEQKNIIYKWILQGAQNLVCQNMCDSNIYTYSGAVSLIIRNKCQGCHSGTSAGGGISLDSYTAIQTVALNGRLWGAVNHIPGYKPMPQNGNKLSDCELTQIRKWIDGGALQN